MLRLNLVAKGIFRSLIIDSSYPDEKVRLFFN